MGNDRRWPRESAVERVRRIAIEAEQRDATQRRESVADRFHRLAEEAEQRERGGSTAAEASAPLLDMKFELHALRHACMDWRLARGDLAVYAVLLKHADGTRECYPGPKRISDHAAIAVSNVKASLRRLEDLKYVRVIRPGTRKVNRYVILDSPVIPSKKAALARLELARELGMQTGPDAKRSRGAPKASPTRQLDMRTGPDAARNSDATRNAGRPTTGHAGSSELGMRTGYELALNSLNELAFAAKGKSQ